MAGLYSHTTRAAGTVVTATVYNDDHEKHVNNHDPEMMDDFSANAAGMQSAVDPYPGASESLPTSLSGELQRIRYVLREHLTAMHGGVAPGAQHWYVPTTDGHGFETVGAHVKRTALYSLANAAWTAIPFDAEEEDTDAYHDNAVNNTRITIPSTTYEGKYFVAANVEFAIDAVGGRGVRIVREVAVGPSTEVIVSHYGVGSGAADATQVNVGTVIHLLVGDYLTCEAYQSSGGALNLSLAAEHAPRLMAWRIGR